MGEEKLCCNPSTWHSLPVAG